MPTTAETVSKTKYHGVLYPWCFKFDLISRGYRQLDTTGLYVRGVVSFCRMEVETQDHRHEVCGMGEAKTNRPTRQKLKHHGYKTPWYLV